MPSEQELVVPMRLQKFLARAGVASRRGSEDLMTAGRVCVNGEVVSELGSKVDPRVDVVTVDGREVSLADESVYIVLDKPAGYVTTMSDPQGRPCVASLVPTDVYPGLFPVGRLDRDTTGVLLFTTDGEAGQILLHPSKHVRKHYVALVSGRPTVSELDELRHGIVLDDGPCQPAEVEVLKSDSPLARIVAPNGVGRDSCAVGISIREGRKHQVKRMMLAVGHPVETLHRDSFGPLTCEGLKPGNWRVVNERELKELRKILEMGGDRHGE